VNQRIGRKIQSARVIALIARPVYHEGTEFNEGHEQYGRYGYS